MAGTKIEKQNAIILFPLRLNQNNNIIGLIQVYKDAHVLKFDTSELNNIDLRKYFVQLPGPAKSCLYNLSNEAFCFLKTG